MLNSIQIKAADAFVACHGYTAAVARIRNTSAVSIDYRVGGTISALAAGASVVLDTTSSTGEIEVRRTDLSATPANVLVDFGITAEESYELSTTAAAAAVAGAPKGAIVWRRMGDVLSSVSPTYAFGEPDVLYETGAQVIVTALPVFKLWHTAGIEGVNRGIYYAESLDGITWSRKAGAVIASIIRGTVVRVGAKLYYFSLPSGMRYESDDGITWSAGVPLSFSGASNGWENNGGSPSLNNCSVIVEGGVWKMLYEGGQQYQVGLVTSTDGINWVRSGPAPVIAYGGNIQCVSGPYWRKVGARFYAWCQCSPITSSSVTNPTDIYRFSSDDGLAFARDHQHPTFQRISADEGPKDFNGQTSDCTMVEVNGRVYMYYVANASDPFMLGRIKCAVADLTFEKLVQTSEGGDSSVTTVNEHGVTLIRGKLAFGPIESAAQEEQVSIGSVGVRGVVIKHANAATGDSTLRIDSDAAYPFQCFQDALGNSIKDRKFYITPRLGLGEGVVAPTAQVHIRAGVAAAAGAPLKLDAGVKLTTPEAGAIEFDGTNLYFTTAAGVRKTITAT